METLEKVKNEPPDPPSKSNTAVEKDLELICLKCLDKEPMRRYSSGEALADELERYLAGKPLSETRPVGRAERLWRWCRRNPASAALTTGLVLALATVAVVFTVAYFQLSFANDQERASRARAEENLKVARDAIAYFAKLSEHPQMQKRGLEAVRHDMRSQAKNFYAALVLHQPEDIRLEADRGHAFLQLGRMTRLLGSTSDALAANQQSKEIFERLTTNHPGHPEYANGFAQALLEQGTVFQVTGRIDDARAAVAHALELAKHLCDQQPDEVAYQDVLAKAYFQLGRLHQFTQRPDWARDTYTEALGRFERLVSDRPEPIYEEHLARTHMNLGTTYALPTLIPLPGAPANGVQARMHYAAAQDILEKLDPENAEYQNLLAEVHHLVGRMARDGGRPKDAIAPFDSALAILTALTQKYTDVPEYQFRLGALHHAQGFTFLLMKQLDRAKASYEKAVAVTEPLAHEYELADYQRELGALCYDRACLAGVTAAALKDAQPSMAEQQSEFDRHAQDANEQLRKSWDSGFLKSPAIFTHFKTDSDLAAFRDRDDFKKLVAELESKLPTR
jgi:tetratricopeptide (TPR) repeat protein